MHNKIAIKKIMLVIFDFNYAKALNECLDIKYEADILTMIFRGE